MATIEDIYKKKDLHEHILSRPDMYIGSTKKVKDNVYVFSDKEEKIVKKEVEYVPGFLKIFDEILVNAIDHSVRDPSVTGIKVIFDTVSGEITVTNNGSGIPIVIHKEYNVYVPELIFGNLLTSSNYDDSKSRIVGGLNGLGANLTNIYSKKFIIETVSAVKSQEDNLYYHQEFSNNMFNKTDPKIKKTNKKTYTKISFIPDFKRFSMTHLDENTLHILKKRVYDAAASTSKDVSVYLNGEKISRKDFKDYTGLYLKEGQEVIYEKDSKWEYAVAYNPDAVFSQVSFVNGIFTSQGGKHVDYIANMLIKKLLEKKKLEGVKSSYIKDRLFIFVKATIVNPSFSSQTKEYLSTSPKDFGFKPEISDNFVNKIYSKTDLVEDVLSFAKYKNLKELDKTADVSSTKRKTKLNIPGLEDAHNAGTSKSSKCMLFLTEGLSAKTFAMSGLSVTSRNNYGVFPLKGKLLNVREATQKQLVSNEEVNNIKKIVGLSHGVKYTSVDSLRYGKICILTDADYDGIHIKALIVNMIHTWFPELLEIKGFIVYMKTPIVKVSNKSDELSFYSVTEYTKWKDTNDSSKWSTKYYKGLGTSTAKEAKEIFKGIPGNIVNYFSSSKSETDKALNLAFEKKKAEERKVWLKKYNFNLVMDQSDKDISYKDLVNKELIHFSMYDVLRSIPCICDGLKPSHRKVLHTMFKRNFSREIKVAQLGAAVAEMTSYHHGEASLYGTIINMAQDYTGSNNINLLKPNGQFGTRLASGKDAASPRYIFTELEDIAKKIFPVVDLDILDYLEDDGQKIEPRYFMPILPMVLVNGTQGIGTGYSTNIPSYNPKEIRKNILSLLSDKGTVKMTPWYKNFNGSIVPDNEGFLIIGRYSFSENEMEISEIPIGTSIDDYKEFLEKMVENQEYEIKDIQNNSTETEAKFKIKFAKSSKFLEKIKKDRDFTLKTFRLTKNISTNNFHLLDENGVITKYKSAEEILEKFVLLRLGFNKKRKDFLIKKFSDELEILNNKIRFLSEIMANNLVVFKKAKQELEKILENENYTKKDDNYSYLINMPIFSFTKETLDDLDKKKAKAIKNLESTETKTITDMFVEDLSSLF